MDTLDSSQHATEYISGAAGGGLPLPSKARFAMLTITPPDFAQGGQDVAVGDVFGIADSGVADNFTLPTASAGATNVFVVIGGPDGSNLRTAYSHSKFIWPNRSTRCYFTMKYDNTGNVSSAGEFYWGIGNAIAGTDPLTVDGVWLGIQKVAGVQASHIILYTIVGGAVNAVDTGVPVVYGQRYSCQINVKQGQAVAIIDGKAVATSVLHVPTTTPLYVGTWFHGSGTIIGAQHNIVTFEYIYAENSTP